MKAQHELPARIVDLLALCVQAGAGGTDLRELLSGLARGLSELQPGASVFLATWAPCEPRTVNACAYAGPVAEFSECPERYWIAWCAGRSPGDALAAPGGACVLPMTVGTCDIGVLVFDAPEAARASQQPLLAALMPHVAEAVDRLQEAALMPQPEGGDGADEELSQLRLIEEKLERERNLLRTIIDSIPHYIYVKDRAGRFLLANKTWLDRVKPGSSVEGTTVYDWFPRDIARSMDQQDRPVLESGAAVVDREQRVQFTMNGGGRGYSMWSSTTKVPLRDARGQILGLIGISRDITAQRRLEHERLMEHAVTRVLSQSLPVDQTMQALLETMGRAMGWEYGARWMRDEAAGLLRRCEMWCAFDFQPDDGDDLVWREAGADNSGRLLHKALRDRQAAWIVDLREVPQFKRSQTCAKLGFRSAYAFPVLVEDRVEGVVEFFGRDVREPDEGVLAVTDAIGKQLGQFIRRKQAEEQLQRLAHYDILTGVPNRGLLYDRARDALEDSTRRGLRAALLFCDVDRFKSINDTLGHAAGDALLCQVAARLTACVRATDTVARVGGDEFALVLPYVGSRDDAECVAGKIIAAFQAPFRIAERDLYVTVSLGLTVYPEEGDSVDRLLRNADSAMYEAKRAGRNAYRWHVADLANDG